MVGRTGRDREVGAEAGAGESGGSSSKQAKAQVRVDWKLETRTDQVPLFLTAGTLRFEGAR